MNRIRIEGVKQWRSSDEGHERKQKWRKMMVRKGIENEKMFENRKKKERLHTDKGKTKATLYSEKVIRVLRIQF